MVLSKETEQPGADGFSLYINRLLGALTYNLESKADLYDDKTKKEIFLLNNYHFINKRLENNKALLEIGAKTQPKFGSNYSALALERRENFMSYWEKMEEFTNVEGLKLASGKSTDKEKTIIKEKFKNFNNSFEELITKCMKTTIFNDDLATELKTEIHKKLVDNYGTFLKTFEKKDFTSKPEKYLKYTKDSLAEKISSLFDKSV